MGSSLFSLSSHSSSVYSCLSWVLSDLFQNLKMEAGELIKGAEIFGADGHFCNDLTMVLSSPFLRFSHLCVRQVNEFLSRPLKQISLSLSLSLTRSLPPSSSLFIPRSLFSLFSPLLSFREAILKGSKMTPHWPYSLVHGKQSHILHPHRLCLLTMVLPCVLFQGRKPAPLALYFSGKSQKPDYCILK